MAHLFNEHPHAGYDTPGPLEFRPPEGSPDFRSPFRVQRAERLLSSPTPLFDSPRSSSMAQSADLGVPQVPRAGDSDASWNTAPASAEVPELSTSRPRTSLLPEDNSGNFASSYSRTPLLIGSRPEAEPAMGSSGIGRFGRGGHSRGGFGRGGRGRGGLAHGHALPPASHALPATSTLSAGSAHLSAGSFPSYTPAPSSPFAQRVQTLVQEGVHSDPRRDNSIESQRLVAETLLHSLTSSAPQGFLHVHAESGVFCAVTLRNVDAIREVAVVQYTDSHIDGLTVEVPLAHLFVYSLSFHGKVASSFPVHYWPATVTSQLMSVHLPEIENRLRRRPENGASAVTPIRRDNTGGRVEFLDGNHGNRSSDRNSNAPLSEISDNLSTSTVRRRKRNPKLDMKAVPMYMGDNKIGDPTDVTLRPIKWLCCCIRSLRGQGVDDEDFVQCALLYMKPNLAELYEQNVMRPLYAPNDGSWTIWNSEYPPDPRSLEIGTFAKWLRSTFINPALVDEVRFKLEKIAQKSGESVLDYNRRFDELHSILHETTENDDLHWMHPQDSKWIRKQYVGGLLQHLRDVVMQLETAAHATQFLDDARSDSYHSDVADPLQRRELNTPYLSMQTLNAQRFSFPLRKLQQVALHAEYMRRQNTFLQEQRQPAQSGHRNVPAAPNAAPNVFFRQLQQQRARGGRPLGPGRRADSPAPPAMRINALRADAQVPVAPGPHDHDSLALYARLAQEGKVQWSKQQLNKLRAENRCFRCGQTGHSKADCQSPPADPVTVRFNNMELVDEEDLEDDDDMYQRLLELDTDEDESGNDSSTRV